CVTVRPSAITARTALYLCSVTLNSLMRRSVRYQPGHLSGISRSADRHPPGRFCRASAGSAHTDLVPARGLEPRTIGLKDRCSNQAELRRPKGIVAVTNLGGGALQAQ